MDFRTLSQEEYDRKLREVIVGTEGHHARVQDVGDNLATIGWGYTLNNHHNVATWRRAGIELTPEQMAVLARVDQARGARKTEIGLTFDKVLTPAESDRLLRASLHDYEAPAVTAGMPLSDERIAVVSVTYNRGPGTMRNHAAMTAIAEGDRAEAWYQLRYNCWGSVQGMEGGLRKRRFAESEIFGLYDNPQAVSVEEAAAVYRMYREHHAEIDSVERRFGVTVDGVEARPNRIAHANRDYPDIVTMYGQVQTIADSLEPARSTLIGHLRTRYPALAGELTEQRFNAALIEPERFPAEFAVGPTDDARRGRHHSPDLAGRAGQPQPGPFQNEHLNQAVAALASGDTIEAERAIRGLTDSDQGLAFIRAGEETRARDEEAGREAVPR